MTEEHTTPIDPDLQARIDAASWYHTIDLGDGRVTPGAYDHRPYLPRYGLPEDLTGKTALDLGAASGFFSFEMERRGAQVTAVDLPDWDSHDFGPNYQPDQDPETANRYLHEPFEIAKEALGSKAEKRRLNIYDVSPQTVGVYDIVFCGSLLIHLTDPIRALWNIASVTREKAIIATSITPAEAERPIATMVGYDRGDGWWLPTRRTLELMTASAGFAGVEWFSEFYLNYSDGSTGPYHGVIHAYKTGDGWTANTRASQDIIAAQRATVDVTTDELSAEIERLQSEVERLQTLVNGYEQGRVMRLMNWIQGRN